jgi:hypothetical protein
MDTGSGIMAAMGHNMLAGRAMATDDLEAFIDEGIRRSIEAGYHPTIFVGMRAAMERSRPLPG